MTITLKEQAFSYLHGKIVEREGMTGTLRYEHYEARYPYAHTVHKLTWEADAKSRETEAYLYVRRQLGDDWSSDLTDSDCWCDWLGEDFQ
jgi:hypothetical protein